MAIINVVVQASSTSWHGGADLCMNKLNGEPVVKTTIERFLHYSSNVVVTVAMPDFDNEDTFSSLIKGEEAARCHFYKGDSESPLRRLVGASSKLLDSDYVIRVDGLHFAVLVDEAVKMLDHASAKNLDCVKFPDDFPGQFSSDIYRVGALRELLSSNPNSAFQVHPKYAMFADTEKFSCDYHQPPLLGDQFLLETRGQAEAVYVEPRMEVSDKKIAAGDQLSFHYNLALEYLPQSGHVLDIACGGGYGSRMMVSSTRQVTGGDIEEDVVNEARSNSRHLTNIDFVKADVTNLQFSSASFDAVVSMETIEHVNDSEYLSEISRVLKIGGLFILSTPQNSLGHIPVNAMHIKEYAREELVELCNQYFNVEKIIGLKQGCIIIPGSPAGGNMMLVCRKL